MSTIDPPNPSTLLILGDGRGALGINLRLARKTTSRELLIGQGIVAPLTGFVGEKGRLGDVIHTFRPSVYIVSPRFVSALRAIDATGWTATPIELEDLAGADGYALFGVTGRCGRTIGASDIPTPGLHPYGRYLDMSTWDGSDVFLPESCDCIFLTPRCASALKRANLVNIRLDPTGLEALPSGGVSEG